MIPIHTKSYTFVTNKTIKRYIFNNKEHNKNLIVSLT